MTILKICGHFKTSGHPLVKHKGEEIEAVVEHVIGIFIY